MAAKNKTAITTQQFAPGTKVGIYKLADVEQERRAGTEPKAESVKTLTIPKEGDPSVEGLAPGEYAAVAERPPSTSFQDQNNPSSTAINTVGAVGDYQYVAFTVKSAAQLKKNRERSAA